MSEIWWKCVVGHLVSSWMMEGFVSEMSGFSQTHKFGNVAMTFVTCSFIDEIIW